MTKAVFLFLVFLSISFTGCDDDDSQNNSNVCVPECDNISHCVNGQCILNDGACRSTSDCSEGICNLSLNQCDTEVECFEVSDCPQSDVPIFCSKLNTCEEVLPAHSNPIIETNDFFSGSNWNDPHVLADNGGYVMYASASANFDENIKIYRLISADLINWELSPEHAVFEKNSDPMSWDKKSVETPAVVKFGGIYHLFYTSYPENYADATSFQIGHATSEDGITWARDTNFELKPTDPQGEVNLDFNQFIVGEPAPVVVGSNLHLYFTAVGANATVGTTLQVIGLTVFDGETWTSPVAVLTPDQILWPREQYLGFSTPNALYSNNQVHLYFDVVKADPWTQVAISHAVSDDGLSSWTMDSDPIFVREDFSWTQEEIRSPSVIEVHSTKVIFFAGHTDTNLAIGVELLQ